MKCFNHPNTEAVGICKNCSKGICHQCLTEIPNGIACTTSCVEEVTLVNNLIFKNVRSKNTAVGAYLRYALLYALMGTVFIAFGIYNNEKFGFSTIMGILFLLGAAFHLVNAKKQKDKS